MLQTNFFCATIAKAVLQTFGLTNKGGVMSDSFSEIDDEIDSGIDGEIDVDGIANADNQGSNYGFSGGDDFVSDGDYSEGGKKKIILIACAALVVIVLVALVILLTQKKPKKVIKTIAPQESLELNDTLLIPAPQALSREYITGRVTGEKWQSEEAQKWFTAPTENQMLDLGKINNHSVQEIINSAP